MMVFLIAIFTIWVCIFTKATRFMIKGPNINFFNIKSDIVSNIIQPFICLSNQDVAVC